MIDDTSLDEEEKKKRQEQLAKEYLAKTSRPAKEPDSNGMVEVAPGVVSMSAADAGADGKSTLQRYENSLAQEAAAQKAAQPDYSKANAALDKRLEDRKKQEEASVARGKAFFDGIAKRNEINKLAEQDLAIAKREYSNARRVEGAMRTALNRYRATNGREGQLVTAEQMGRAQNMLANARLGLGPTDNVDERRTYFRQRVNPWQESPVAKPSQTSNNGNTASAPAFSLSADPAEFSDLQTEEEKKRRRSLFPNSPLGALT